ncbi:MAG: helix-turn-helix domain-containing protein [Caulobacteraceae bacterium]
MKTVDYRYDESGLDNVILKGLRAQTDDAGETVINIPRINLLHKVLTHAVASKSAGLLPKEIRFLRTELGHTQAELARLVGKDAQTVGRWERGETTPDQAAEMVIRARAIEHAGVKAAPAMEALAQMTVKSGASGPFLIDARNPKRYRPMKEAA